MSFSVRVGSFERLKFFDPHGMAFCEACRISIARHPELAEDTCQPHEIGIFVRSTRSLTFREKYSFLTLHPVRLLM